MLSSWTQGDVVLAGDVRLHYYRTGRGDKTPLVLVHGFSDNGLCWSRAARDLEAEFDVVMPDMRGHGLSERMRSGDEVDMAADLAGLIEALRLTRPIVGGHSMGAMAAYELGVRFPELVSALVLEDPPWWLEQPSESQGQPIGDWARSLAGKTQEELLTQYRAEHPDWPDELVQTMAEAKRQLDQAIVDTLVGRVDRVAADWQSTIGGLTQPTLIVTGNPELGGIVTPAVVARIRELNPRVAIVNVPNVGHLVRFDNHEAFMVAVRAFLAQSKANSQAGS